MRVADFDFELPPTGSRCGRRGLATAHACCWSMAARSPTAQVLELPDLLGRRRAGVQRHQGHPGAARGTARRGEHRRDLAQARRAARVAGLPPQRQAGARRRHDRFGDGVRIGRREATTGRRCFTSTARSRSSCCSNGPAGCRFRPTSPRSGAVDEADRADYQTMFAREEGAVAAPTAALHFTPRLLEALDARGIGARR